jgi:hypothetical protein
MNKQERKEYMRLYCQKHKKEILAYQRAYYYLHKQEKSKAYQLNKEIISKKGKEYRRLNKEKVSKQKKRHYLKYRQKYLEQFSKYYEKHKKEITLYKRIYKANRLKNDLNFKIEHNLRCRIRLVLKGINKSKPILKLLGCSIKFLKKYLESQFKIGMAWDNYGTGWYGNGMKEWHIDHIRPCCTFDLSKPSEQAKCFHYTNLQPLWAKENLEKSKNYLKIK